MKKFLLTTTAVSMFSAVANAGTPVITVGGHANFQFGIADQADLYDAQNGGNSLFSRDYHSRTDTEIYFNIDGETDNALRYGAYIELEADVSGDDGVGENNNAERASIYVEYQNFGRIEAGATGDAGDRLRIDASRFNSTTLASATGGIGGDFNRYVDLSNDSAATGSNFYILPGLPSAVGLAGEAAIGVNGTPVYEARATANKISYYTPRIEGFQFGLSYTPDQGERGTAAGFSGDNDGSIRNVWNAGLNFERDFDIDGHAFGIAASATGEIGENEQDLATPSLATDDLEAYAFGLSATYFGFTLGGSYGVIEEFGNLATLRSDAKYWTAGGAYKYGPFSTSVTFLSSEVDNATAVGNEAEFTNLSVGADYQLAPGLLPYVEVSFFDTDDGIADTATEGDNDGTVVIVGTQLTF